MSDTIESHIRTRGDTLNQQKSPFAVMDISGNIRFVNKQAALDFGYSDPQPKNLNISKLIINPHPQEIEFKSLLLNLHKAERLFKRGTPTEDIGIPEVEVLTPDRRRRFLQIKPTFIHSTSAEGAKKIEGIEFEMIDITRQKHAETLRRTSELISSNLTLEEILKTLPVILRGVVPHDSANIMLLNKDHSPSSNISWTYDDKGYPVQRTPTFNSIDTKSVLQNIIDSKKPVIIDETETHAGWEKTENPSDNVIRSYLGVPIISEGKVIGFLNFNSFKPNIFSSTDINLLQGFSTQLTKAMANAAKVGEISRLAITDGLTGLPNRRRLDELFLAEITRALRFGEHLTTVIADIDYFKSVNDTYGHPVGDKVLQELARRFKSELRDTDFVGRYGGEEFEGILPVTSTYGAHILAEKLRRLVEETPFRYNENQSENVTISIGVASLPTTSPLYQDPKNVDHETIREDMRSHADEALYVVKKLAGKNGVGIYLPAESIKNIHGEMVSGFDQVAVVRYKHTDDSVKNSIVRDMPVDIKEDYLEIQIFARKISETGKVEYTPHTSYHAYYENLPEDKDKTILIFAAIDGDESDYPAGYLSYGPTHYSFEGTSAYHQAIDNGQQPHDTFSWINILFPKDIVYPGSKPSSFI